MAILEIVKLKNLYKHDFIIFRNATWFLEIYNFIFFSFTFFKSQKYSLDTPISLPHERVKITSVQTLQNKNFLKFIKNILKWNKFLSSFLFVFKKKVIDGYHFRLKFVDVHFSEKLWKTSVACLFSLAT